MNDLITLAKRAAARNGGPAGWEPYLFEKALNGVVCTGAVCPPITRGENKGKPNFRKMDKNTTTKVVISHRWRNK